MLFIRPKCDEESVGRAGGRKLLYFSVFYLFFVANDSYSYYVSLVL